MASDYNNKMITRVASSSSLRFMGPILTLILSFVPYITNRYVLNRFNHTNALRSLYHDEYRLSSKCKGPLAEVTQELCTLFSSQSLGTDVNSMVSDDFKVDLKNKGPFNQNSNFVSSGVKPLDA